MDTVELCTYHFSCSSCGMLAVKQMTRDKFIETETYCDCGSKMKRYVPSDGHANVIGTEKGDTFWSQSLAISPLQAAEHRRLFPGVRIREDGCIGFDSVRQRSEYLQKTGFEKMPGKARRRGRKIH